MKLVKFFAVAVAAVAMLAACEPEEKKPINKPVELTESKILCDVTAGGWENCNAWAWTEGGDNYTGGADAVWPGVALETEEIDGVTYYVWTAPAHICGQTIGFIINNGTEQTVDLSLVVEDGAKVVLTEKGADGKWLASINGEVGEVPEPEPVVDPELNLNEHDWGLIGSFNDWAADVTMEIVDGWAVATIELAADAEFKVRADGAWDHSYGFAATEEMPTFPVDGNQFAATYNAGNLKVAEAGTYEVSFSAANGEEYFKVLKK